VIGQAILQTEFNKMATSNVEAKPVELPKEVENVV
jgi:hypothetical protein